MIPPLPRPPVALRRAVDDTGLVHRLIDEHAPYWPVQRYFANSAEYAALSGKEGPMIVGPVFRGNWATEGRMEAGVEPLLRHRPFIEAAKRPFDARSSARRRST